VIHYVTKTENQIPKCEELKVPRTTSLGPHLGNVGVEQPVSEHLSLGAGWIQGEGSVVSGVQTKLEPLLLAHQH